MPLLSLLRTGCRWWLLLGLLAFSCAVSAQTNRLLEGQVLDAAHHAPVPFATLGIRHQPLGSAADAQGRFRFAVPAAADTARLIVSCVGFEPATLAVAAFRGGPQQITLRAAPVSLGEVTVRGGWVKTRTYGRTGAATFMTAALYTEPDQAHDELAKEQGTVLRIDPECRLREVSFHVAFNRFRRVRFRLNLYAMQNGKPTRRLPHPDVLFEVTQPRGWGHIDLEPYKILLRGQREVALTLQWLQSEAEPDAPKGFALSAIPAPGSALLFRDKSQDQWRTVRPGRLSLYLTADVYAPAAASEGESDNRVSRSDSLQDQDFVLPDSLRYLDFVESTARGQPVGRHFGDSTAVGHTLRLRDGTRLYYEQYGQGAPLLLLHGNGQSIGAFGQQIDALARFFRVIAVDTRAQGHSTDASRGPLTYDLFAADALQLLDALHLPRASILGWSDGGNTALKVALAAPDRVDRLVLMGANLFPTEQALAPGVVAGFRGQLSRLPPDSANTTPARLLRLLLTEPQLTFADLRAIRAPTLVLAGQYDVIREDHTRALAQSIAGAHLTIFAGASHNAPQEIPFGFNQTVLAFLLAK